MTSTFAASVWLMGTLAAQPPPGAPPVEVATIATPAPASTFLLAKTGRLVAAVCDDRKLRLWSLPERKLLREIDLGERHVDSAAMSDDGGWIAAGDHGGVYTVWDTSSGAEQMHVAMAFYPSALAFSADGKRLAIAPVGEPVQIYDPVAGKKLFDLRGATGGTTAVVFSRDRELIATTDADTAVRIYDGRSGAMLDHNTEFLLEPFTASFTPDGKQLMAAGADKTVMVLDVATGDVIRKSAKAADPIAYLEVSPDGKLVVAALMHADNMAMPSPVLILETDTGKQVQNWLPTSIPVGGGWTSDGHLLMATATPEALHIWRVR